MNRSEKYRQKVLELVEFDKQYSNGIIAGIDEVGRGPLAGDVVVCLCSMPYDKLISRVDDSKKLSIKARLAIEEEIRSFANYIQISSADVFEIDEYNILNATKLAMYRASESFNGDMILLDAMQNMKFKIPHHSIIKGDAKSYAIACASVVAKVYRDKQMLEYANIYPQYHFEKNMGYGTAEHIAALKKYGPCPIHRKSFIKKILGEHNV